MTTFNFFIQVVIPSGIIGALAGGLVNYFSSKNLDVHVRTMEARKQVYTKVNELFSAFYDTATDEETRVGKDGLLKCFREIQIWGSDEVVRCFSKLLFAINIKNGISQEERNDIFKKFVIAMRHDILGKTELTPEEITIHGRITKSR